MQSKCLTKCVLNKSFPYVESLSELIKIESNILQLERAFKCHLPNSHSLYDGTV